jgi:hypothetical protein
LLDFTWEVSMLRTGITALVLSAAVAAPAVAQDIGAGAGRVEISAAPIGGVFFMRSADDEEPRFDNYGIGAAFAGNLNRWVGLEADFGVAVGRRQNLTFIGAPLVDQKTPNLFSYTGGVVVNPWGSNRAWVPYVAGGVGGMTLLNAGSADPLDVDNNHTFLTTNVGGGLRWFANDNWGIRGDYRVFFVRGQDDAPLFFGREDRRAHRVSASFIFTY